MEAELNIANILKDKPSGTKLYADAFGELSLECVNLNRVNSIYQCPLILKLLKVYLYYD